MHINKDGKVAHYTTKKERIDQLEGAMAAIEAVSTLEEAKIIAAACRRTDRRWAKASPAGFTEVKAVQDREEGGPCGRLAGSDS